MYNVHIALKYPAMLIFRTMVCTECFDVAGFLFQEDIWKFRDKCLAYIGNNKIPVNTGHCLNN